MRLIFFLSLVLIKSLHSFSQNCHEFFPFAAGTEWEISAYDEKNKLLSVGQYKITGISNNVADVSVRSTDQKGRELMNIQTKWYCKDGMISFEMKDIFPQNAAMNNTKAEMKFSGTNLEFPGNLNPGLKLPDADAKLEMYIDGMRFMTMNIRITDRQVEGNEQVSTPIGTLECIKISQTSEVKSIISSKSKTSTWISKNKGMVKSESYNQKGKLTGYQLMTKFKS